MVRIKAGIPQSLYANSEMIENSVHDGLSCTDCHAALDGIDDFPHDPHILGVNCADCHPDALDEYMSGFYDHLAERGFTNIPGCTQCHGTHTIAGTADTRTVCGICHNEHRIRFEKSVHYDPAKEGEQEVSCTSCHKAHVKSEKGKMLPRDWRVSTVQRCLGCHEKEAQDYITSLHFKGVEAGVERAPICADCHDQHEIYMVDDPRSKVHVDKLDRTCDRCHPGHNATIHRKSGVDPRLMTCVACHTGHRTRMKRVEGTVFKEVLAETCKRCHGEVLHQNENLAHGGIMTTDPDGGGASCVECHVYHWDLPTLPQEYKRSLSYECLNCHADQNRNYLRSAHGIARRKGHDEAPTCVTCHGDSEVERISSRFTGQTIISLCGSCHANNEVTMRFQLNPNVISGYLNTYHGQVYALGYQGREFATCISCHDNHLILPSDNPESTISQQHILNTCGRCHEDVNPNFVKQLQHYDPMTTVENPILKAIHTFMLWLLGVTLSVFGLHTILWLSRALYDRIKRGPKLKNLLLRRQKYLRFGIYERVLHGMIIISFLMLAMTGLPLKYAHTSASQWIVSNLFGLRTMAILHRIGAGITLGYFTLHLGKIGVILFSGKRKLKEILWGPNSMVPQPNDFKEFAQHVGFFLGIAKKPQFGRFSYWEKFDYFAVFWGVAMIGLSGLALWFPMFFTRLLPGWAVNAAHIIHSEEALLATGFIFTIHFFNEHLRPENFPFDEVIFTGRIRGDYLFEDRKVWLKQIKKEGRLEEILVKPLNLWLRIPLFAFGFTALGIGLALLALIVIGTFF